MGRALAPFIHYWLVERRQEFVENIIIGSGVARLGDGLKREGKGVLESAIRKALDQAQSSLGVGDYDTAQVITSRIGVFSITRGNNSPENEKLVLVNRE